MRSFFVILTFFSSVLFAAPKTEVGQFQVRSVNGAMDASALFGVYSTTKGAINAPAQTTTQRNAIASPVAGLRVFNTSTARPNFYDGSAWQELATTVFGEPKRNYDLNSDFSFWQRGTTTTIANTTTAYMADRHYVKNVLGTNGVITYAKTTTSLPDNVPAAAEVKITTAPTVGQTNGTEFYSTLENKDSLAFYNTTGSLSAQVKALGNVTSVGLQFFYKTTEAKVDTTIGSEQVCTVTSAAWALCSISGQAMGTAQTTSGVIGYRIRISGVSSGNTYDLNNGFQVTQIMLNTGSAPDTWRRQNPSLATELQACNRYYWKSFDTDVTPVQSGGAVGALEYRAAGSFGHMVKVVYPTPHRVNNGTVTTYNPAAAAATWRNASASTNNSTPTISNQGTSGFGIVDTTGSATPGQSIIVQVSVDSDI